MFWCCDDIENTMTAHRAGDDLARGGRVGRTGLRTILVERQMCSRLVITLKAARQHTAQVTLIEDVIETRRFGQHEQFIDQVLGGVGAAGGVALRLSFQRLVRLGMAGAPWNRAARRRSRVSADRSPAGSRFRS